MLVNRSALQLCQADSSGFETSDNILSHFITKHVRFDTRWCARYDCKALFRDLFKMAAQWHAKPQFGAKQNDFSELLVNLFGLNHWFLE